MLNRSQTIINADPARAISAEMALLCKQGLQNFSLALSAQRCVIKRRIGGVAYGPLGLGERRRLFSLNDRNHDSSSSSSRVVLAATTSGSSMPTNSSSFWSASLASPKRSSSTAQLNKSNNRAASSGRENAPRTVLRISPASRPRVSIAGTVAASSPRMRMLPRGTDATTTGECVVTINCTFGNMRTRSSRIRACQRGCK